MAKNLSTFSIAQMLHVDPGSVANWIDQGLLKAHRTPGGHRRVAAEDLLEFLRQHKMPIPQELQARAKRVLIVDDNPAITQLVAQALTLEFPDLEISQAHDGFHAGTVIAAQKPDVVVLDLRMPGMDGYDVCKMIKSQQGANHTVVLAMTAYADEENVARILACGAKVCLRKPLDMDELLKEVRANLET